MTLEAWAWYQLLLVIAVYWALLLGRWWFYTTRPSTQARARARGLRHVETDPETGEVLLGFEATANLLPIAAVLLGPPVLLIVFWLAA